jgi:hypothetical protein
MLEPAERRAGVRRAAGAELVDLALRPGLEAREHHAKLGRNGAPRDVHARDDHLSLLRVERGVAVVAEHAVPLRTAARRRIERRALDGGEMLNQRGFERFDGPHETYEGTCDILEGTMTSGIAPAGGRRRVNGPARGPSNAMASRAADKERPMVRPSVLLVSLALGATLVVVTTTSSAVPQCPTGTEEVAAKCMALCPKGTARTNGPPFDCKSTGPLLKCAAGEEPVGDKCRALCPAGTARTNGPPFDCKSTGPLLKCAAGEEPVGDKCRAVCPAGTARTNGPPFDCKSTRPLCRRGEELVGDTCRPLCPAGQTRSRSGTCTAR